VLRAESVFQNQVRENAQNRNAEQTDCRTEDHDPIWPVVSDDAGPQNNSGRPDHRYSGTGCHQYQYVAGPVQSKRSARCSGLAAWLNPTVAVQELLFDSERSFVQFFRTLH
jgi:hypothetical protein